MEWKSKVTPTGIWSYVFHGLIHINFGEFPKNAFRDIMGHFIDKLS